MYGLNQIQQSFFRFDATHAHKTEWFTHAGFPTFEYGKPGRVNRVGFHKNAGWISLGRNVQQFTLNALRRRDHDVAQFKVKGDNLEFIVLQDMICVAADTPGNVEQIPGHQRHQGSVVEEIGVQVVWAIHLCHTSERKGLQEIRVAYQFLLGKTGRIA